MALYALLLPATAAAFCPNGSADAIIKYALPAGNGGKPARILESAEVPPNASTLYLSGQVASPIDPSKLPTSMADLGDTQTQTRNVLGKIEKILKSRGYALSDVIRVTLFLAADPKLGKMDFDGANAAFDAFFNIRGNPTTVARTTVEVSALAGPYYLVEIEATAARVKKNSANNCPSP